MTIGYTGTLPKSLWNPPLPPIQQVHQRLIEALDQELAGIPIRQQTVIIAVRHEEEDAWTVDLLNTPPLRGRYDGWTDCLIDFDQYHGTVGELRRYAAEELASDLLDQAIPAWRHNREFGPHWDADLPDWN